MAIDGDSREDENAAATRGHSRAIALAGDVRRVAWSVRLVPRARSLFARVAADLAAEAESGRLALWLPVAFTVGILVYFSSRHEPSLVAVLGLTGALALATAAARRRPVMFGLCAGLCAFALGFAAGTVRTAMVMHETVPPPRTAVRLSGHVEQAERRIGSDRILLRLDPGPVAGLSRTPQLVRLSLRRGTAPPVGSHVTTTVRLQPPLEPAMPGGHDFGRSPWFRGIDAVGFGLGRPQITPATGPPAASVRIAAVVDAVRGALAARIRAVLTGVPAEIAIALVAGDRSAIPRSVEDSMRTSGLTHILSISGLHMAMVAGTLFIIVRGLLALVPALALRWPIKAIAAVVALAGTGMYLVLSGNDVAAQRSFVMTALVLGGVLAGRRALTLRTVAVAAVVVLGFTPEAALEPGMQMSFAATLALVATYERFRPLRALPRPEGMIARLISMPLVFLFGVVVTSLVAGMASGPYGAFHFQRVAPYGVLANLLAMPAVSLLVMPFGLLGVLLLPFGLDFLAWPVMGIGIELMVAVSDAVARLPGADIRVDTVNTVASVWFSIGLVCLCLLRGTLSWIAVPAFAIAILCAGPGPRPAVLIAPNAATVAVRGPDGRLSVIGARGQKLAVEQWLTREGDLRRIDDRTLAAGFTCDRLGCVAPLIGGGTIAVSHRAEGLAADCLNARIVVTRDAPPMACPARVVTLRELEATGPLAFVPRAGELHAQPTRIPGIARPWLPFPAPPFQDMGDVPAATRADSEDDTGED